MSVTNGPIFLYPVLIPCLTIPHAEITRKTLLILYLTPDDGGFALSYRQIFLILLGCIWKCPTLIDVSWNIMLENNELTSGKKLTNGCSLVLK